MGPRIRVTGLTLIRRIGSSSTEKGKDKIGKDEGWYVGEEKQLTVL